MTFMLTWFVISVNVYNVLSVKVDGNCSSNLLLQFEVTGGQRDNLTCTLYETDSCVSGTLPLQFVGPSVGPPESANVYGRLVQDPQNNLSPQMIVEWTPPDDVYAIKNLTGFLIRIRNYEMKTGGIEDVCRVFDLSSETFHQADTELKFKIKFVGFKGGSGYYYRLALYSLPHSSSDDEVIKYLSLPSFQEGSVINASDWSTFIAYDDVNFTEPATLAVQFNLADSRYNFTGYKVTLKSEADSQNYVLRCTVSVRRNYVCQNRLFPPPPYNQSQLKVSFANVTAGTYSIEIQPVDPFPNDAQCICRKSRNECINCMATETAARFIVEPPSELDIGPTYSSNPDLSTNTKDRFLDKYSALAAAVGSLTGIMLIGIMMAIMTCQLKKKCASDVGYIEGNNVTHNIPLESTKGTQLLILNTNDHYYHKEVINKFALFLANTCKFDVAYLPWERLINDKCAWAIETMDRVDFIIFVNSRLAFQTFQSPIEHCSLQVFNCAISHMKAHATSEEFFKKYLFINFEYTTEEHFIKGINPKAQYQIPDRLNDLIVYLNGDSNEFCPEINNHTNIRASTEDGDLREAIIKALKFQRLKPEWHHRRSSIDNSRVEVPLDFEEVLSVSEIGVSVNHTPPEQIGSDPGILPMHFNPPSVVDSSTSTNKCMDGLVCITLQHEFRRDPSYLESDVIDMSHADKRCDDTPKSHTEEEFIPPDKSVVSDASTGMIEERVCNITRQYESREAAGEGIDVPPLEESEEADRAHATNGQRDRHLQFIPRSILPCVKQSSSVMDPELMKNNQITQLVSEDDDIADISSLWESPSTVGTDLSTSTSVGKLYESNVREEMKMLSADSKGANATDKSMNGSITNSPSIAENNAKTKETNSDEKSRLNAITGGQNRETHTSEYMEELHERNADNPESYSTEDSSSFFSPSDVDSNLSSDSIYQKFININSCDWNESEMISHL